MKNTFVSSKHVHDEVYSIQYYVIKFEGDLQQVISFGRTPVSPINKSDRHDITEITLKLALNTIKQIQPIYNEKL